MRIIFPGENGGVEEIVNVSWLSSSAYSKGSGIIRLCFDPKLKRFLLQLKSHFTNYRLENVVQLKSQYSIRIYELLKQYEKIGQRVFLLEELREILGIEEGEYVLYGNFKQKVLLVAQKELKGKTDLSFELEEIKVGHGVGKLRFYIKSKNQGKAELTGVETAQIVPSPLLIEPPKDENLEKLIALLPQDYRGMETMRKLLKTWLVKQNADYVARNIEYANDGSNAVNPGANPAKKSNYRNYLAKALTGDFGLPKQEDKETKKKAEEAAKLKAQEEVAAQKQRSEQTQNERENQARARVYQQSLPPEALEKLKAEAFSRLDSKHQDLVRRKGLGSEIMLKIQMDKISLERMKIS